MDSLSTGGHVMFHAVRFSLGVGMAAIGISAWRRNSGTLFGFSIWCLLAGIFGIFPAFPAEEWWKYYVQFPILAIGLPLILLSSIDVFGFLPRHTYPQERALLAAGAFLVGMVPVVTGWLWLPENWYQAFMLSRQFALVAISTAYWAAWLWVSWIRPVQIPVDIRAHGWIWGAWLSVMVVMASTTKGGLWWVMFRWSGAESIWLAVFYVTAAAQIIIICLLGLNLRRWPAVPRAGRRDLQCRRAFR